MRAEIDVWRAGSGKGPAQTLAAGDVLDGEHVLPGFVYAVADVFTDPLD